MKNILKITFPILILIVSCKAPTTGYLVKDGGMWNVDKIHYKSTYFDTTFIECGEMSFIKKFPLEKENDPYDYEVEGYISVIAYQKMDLANNYRWIKTIYHFFCGPRESAMAISNKITIFNNLAMEVEVISRTKNEMIWEEKSWDREFLTTYNLSRK